MWSSLCVPTHELCILPQERIYYLFLTPIFLFSRQYIKGDGGVDLSPAVQKRNRNLKILSAKNVWGKKRQHIAGWKKKGNISTLLYICYIYVSKREKRLYRHAQSLWFWSSGSCAGPCDWPLMMLFHWTENSQQPCLIRAATTWALGTAPHGYSHALVLLWVFFSPFHEIVKCTLSKERKRVLFTSWY